MDKKTDVARNEKVISREALQQQKNRAWEAESSRKNRIAAIVETGRFSLTVRLVAFSCLFCLYLCLFCKFYQDKKVASETLLHTQKSHFHFQNLVSFRI